ncbi:MAG: squalene/phytoene synthase family protein [Pseudomonadota bacterium]
MTPPEDARLAALAEEGDPQRAYVLRLAAPEAQDRLRALIAFDAELARIPITVSEPMLGEIRLAWWREALEDLFERGAARGHEALQALAATKDAAGWDRALLDGMIDARALSLGGLPVDEAACGDFVEKTGAAFQRLAVAALGDRSEKAAEVAALVGWAEGAARLADAFRAEAAAREGAGEMAEVAERLAAEGRRRLSLARSRRRDVAWEARAPLCSVLLAEFMLAPAAAPASEGRGGEWTVGARLRLAFRLGLRRF